MAWASTLKRDTDDANTGTIIAVFTAADGAEFTYTARVTRSAGALAAFVAAANSAKDTWETTRAQTASLEQQINDALNGV